MKKEPTTSGLQLDKLGELLRICSETNKKRGDMSLDQERAELLDGRLAETLPVESPEHGPLSRELNWLCEMSGLLRSEPIRDLLCNPEADVSLITKVKDYGKKLSESARSKVEHDTANAIYYAAIASAFVFHDLRITKFSYKDLEHLFAVFSKKKWVPSSMANLFRKANQRCIKKGKAKGKDESHERNAK